MASMGVRIYTKALRTRWFVRAPIGLYRVGLGFVFGSRMLPLQHTGRVSGRPRYVVLEVVEHPAADEYVVVSGFGVKAQWYRNIHADPRVRVSCGTRRNVPATATPLSSAESAAALRCYAAAHPTAWDKLRTTIERAVGQPVDTLPMVRLNLTHSP
ncbi:MAG: nitroreductase family deazaflavin-dependent oxidoreductase [Mycobacterium sp.]|nr:nitroreductase family deazaflavin-dependent oxidoreductase [Mycobacterium sp.]